MGGIRASTMEFLTLHDAVAQHVRDGDQVAHPHDPLDQHVHPGITRQQVCQNTSWEVRFADTVVETEPPSAGELEVLRELHTRTARAHGAAGGSE